ncbi:MAG TPA: DUF1761 domain-containing protein [Acidimicrobiia bacterium]|nr:DUF1761 domain-containing protein [Acidimicrobiia bacterium]
MIFDYFDDLNWLAVLVATIAWFAFSAIWYSIPPLSKAWQEAAKVTPGDGPPLVTVLIPTFIGYFVTSIVIALLAAQIDGAELVDGLALGVGLGVGFGVVGAVIGQLYEQKGRSYWLINGVNALIAYTIVATIVTVWD